MAGIEIGMRPSEAMVVWVIGRGSVIAAVVAVCSARVVCAPRRGASRPSSSMHIAFFCSERSPPAGVTGEGGSEEEADDLGESCSLVEGAKGLLGLVRGLSETTRESTHEPPRDGALDDGWGS